MRWILFPIILVAACSTSEPGPEVDPPSTLRGWLADGVAVLPVDVGESSVAVTARVWRGQWTGEAVEVAIAAGSVVVSAPDEDLVVDELDLALAPIALPASLFGGPARLVDVSLELASDVRGGDTAWQGANQASATATMDVRVRWSLEEGGRTTPLGPVVLANLPLTISVDGDGQQAEVQLDAGVDGVVWGWAHVFELRDLSLRVAART